MSIHHIRWVTVTLSTLFIGSTIWALSQSIDLEKVNEALTKVTDKVVAKNPNVEGLMLKLDPTNTDLDNHSYDLHSFLKYKTTPWSSQPTEFNESTQVKVELATADSNEVIHFNEKLEVKTDTLMFFRTYAKKYAEKCQSDSLADGYTADLACDVATELSNAKDLLEIHGILSETLDRVTTDVSTLNDDVTAWIDQSELRSTKLALKDIKTQLESKLEMLRATQFLKVGDGFSLSISSAKHQKFEVQDLIVHIQQETVVMTGQMKLELGVKLYEPAYPEIRAILTDLQNQNEFAIRHVSAGLTVLLDVFDQML